jgi:NAD(P)-dependent dehydrogenase (short-subunit alcohol dehydrogenase family)
MMKTVLITGGNSGIGYAAAKLFNKKGYSVYITGRNELEVKKAAVELNVNYIIADLSIFSDLKKIEVFFNDIGLDILVNNAGIANPAPIGDYTEDNFNDHINVNLKAPVFLIQSLLPVLEKTKGCVINISSIITRRGGPGFGIYAATKGAIESITRNLAIELAPKNIRINAICPGAIDTPMFEKFKLPEDQAAAAKEYALSTIPLGRFGNPLEIAQVIISQAESTYVTGAVWHVDGGVDT